MAQAKRDENAVPTLLAVSSTDGVTPVDVYANPTTHRLLVSFTGGGGDVVGPASSTDNAVARWDGVTGKLLQDSTVIIGDTGNVTGLGTLNTHTLQGGTSTLALFSNKLSVFAATTSSELAGVISDETGSGALVFANTPTLIAPILGVASGTSLALTTALTLEETGAGTDTITLQAPASIAASYVLTLPVDDGTSGQVLTTDGSGVLSWTTNGAGDVVGPASSTDNAVVRFDSTTGKLLQNSTLGLDDAGPLYPFTDDTVALGDATHNFSDLFLASGAVLNYANGNVVLTHTSGVLTMGTGDLRITTAGTNAASVVTVGGTQTLTNKTLTSPAINTGTVGTSLVPTSNDGAALGSTTNQFSDLFLAEGGVINWDNGDATITQTGNDITVAGITTFGVGTSTAVTLGTIELGAASDTTISRVSAGVAAIEGDTIDTAANTLTLSNKTLTAPKFANAGFIADANGNELIVFTTTASAVNEITIANAATTNDPTYTASGGDSNIGGKFIPKGTGSFYGTQETIIVAISDETTAITTGTAKVTFHMPYAFNLMKVKAGVTAASSSGNPAFDLNDDGVSVFSTTVTIDANETFSDTAATPSVLTSTPLAIASGSVMTIDIDTAGTGAKGAKLYLIGYATAKP